MSVDQWVPSGKGGDVNAFYDRVRPICHGCPVRWDCLTDALEHDDAFGMWGGLTPNQRRGLDPASVHQLRTRREAS